ncbi:MAG: methionine transporter ATP-binding protein [Gemmatimonadetes bacterium]|nr:methionine transporter ATP-binding protein [Gemmatimonadota bacterium]
MTPLLEVRDLRVSFPAAGGRTIHPVDGVSFSLERGRTLALVGESGCGKSLTGLALLRLVPPPGRVDDSSVIRLEGKDLMSFDEAAMRAVRGGRIGMVFQDPMTSLNPVLTAGDQIAEAVRAHRPVTRQEARARAAALLGEVGIADPARRLDEYPHQLSGGMRQRVMIAIALAAEPEIIIADEPTTALDVTVQAQILELLDRLRLERGMAVLLITHDLGVVAGRADDMCVMYAGQIVERASTRQVFEAPAHPYTHGLFGSVPTIAGPRERLTPISGSVPPPAAWPTGCRFAPRCPERFARCDSMPSLRRAGPGHDARCWLTGDEA